MKSFLKLLREQKGVSEMEAAKANNLSLEEYISYEEGNKSACNTIKYSLINYLLQ